MSNDLSALKAATIVLAQAHEPLRYEEITYRIRSGKGDTEKHTDLLCDLFAAAYKECGGDSAD